MWIEIEISESLELNLNRVNKVPLRPSNNWRVVGEMMFKYLYIEHETFAVK